ncbi:MAG: M14 family zinc carboxypeptidase [Bacteroidota bacterium]
MLFQRVSLLLVLLFLFAVLPAQQGKTSRLQRIAVQSSANTFLRQEGYELDHGSNRNTSYVYADRRLLRKLDARQIAYRFATEQFEEVAMVDAATWFAQKSNACEVPGDAYPTYELYEQMMTNFAAAYPQITRLHSLGALPSGRRILALEITDNPNSEEIEPKLLYSSSMHGDELGGYHVMLRFIAHLLCNYNVDPELTALVNESEIWINPLANPDGAYANGNNTVNGATRRNANGVDLNRNYPDPDNGPNPDGNEYQPETLIFMQLAEDVSFDLAMNIHGGAEVFNYPWDTYVDRHADNDWWVHVAREFADECQTDAAAQGFNNYFNDLDNGITNGYDWYPIAGGRQDYMNFYNHAREATLEISNVKLLPPSSFDAVWNSSRDALVNYLLQGTYGLRGTVLDSLTGEPLEASVYIPGHDELNSEVYSKLPTGRYHRYLKEGFYNVTFEAPGYHSKTVQVFVEDQAPTLLTVRLAPLNISSTSPFAAAELPISLRYDEGQVFLGNLPTERRGEWYFQLLSNDGRSIMKSRIDEFGEQSKFSVGHLPTGIYLGRVVGEGQQQTVQFNVVRKKRR